MKFAMRLTVLCLLLCHVIAMDWIPLLSQCKSLVQAACGDLEGARQTQDRFSKQCPIVSQTRSMVHSAMGDDEQARQVQMEQLQLLENVGTAIPVAGHIAGGIAFACGDNERGCKYMKSASRTTAVVGGAIVAGPSGAIIAGAAYDTLEGAIDLAANGKTELGGTLGSLQTVINCKDKSKQGGNVVDFLAGIAGDAMAGNAGAKACGKISNSVKSKCGAGPSGAASKPPSGAASKPPSGAASKPPSGAAPKPPSGNVPKPNIPKPNAKPVAKPPTKASPMPGPKLAKNANVPPLLDAIDVRVQGAAGTALKGSGTQTQTRSGTQTTTQQSNSPQPESSSNGGDNGGGTTRWEANRSRAADRIDEATLTGTTEAEAEDGERRRIINVYDFNMLKIGRVLSANFGIFGNEYIHATIRELNGAIREMRDVWRLFVTAQDNSQPHISPDPQHGQPVQAYPGPYTQTQARCTFGIQDRVQTVTIPRGRHDGPVFGSVRNAQGGISTGFSHKARSRYVHHRRTMNFPGHYGIHLDGNGDIIDRIRDAEACNSLRMTRSVDPPPQDRCAEHHAAFVIYAAGGTAVTSIAFRMDAHMRVFSVHRCLDCMTYDMGVVWTDQLPQNTWLNPPRALRIYAEVSQ